MPKSRTSAKSQPDKYWSGRVTRESNALDLEEGVFTWADPRRIAESLKRSAEASTCRKADPFRSAMSMLVFYINRAGRKLDKRQRRVLEQAKEELRRLYNKSRPWKRARKRSTGVWSANPPASNTPVMW